MNSAASENRGQREPLPCRSNERVSSSKESFDGLSSLTMHPFQKNPSDVSPIHHAAEEEKRGEDAHGGGDDTPEKRSLILLHIKI